MSRDTIIFNNISSKTDLNITVLEGPPTEVNQEQYEEIYIEGRSGSLIYNKGTYPDIKKTFKVTILEYKSQEIYKYEDEIYKWLFCIEDNKLIYDRNDRCYKVKKVILEDIYTNMKDLGNFNITFLCEPFKYLTIENTIELTNPQNINYLGTAIGECNIKIHGSGNIQLTINNDTIQINNVNEYVELDSKLLLCLNKDKTSKSRDMIGHFPILTRGSNEVSWIGDVSKIEILPRTAFK